MKSASSNKHTRLLYDLASAPFAHLLIGVPLEREVVFQKPMKNRHMKALVFRPFHGAKRIVIRLGVDCPHNRRLLARNAYHAAVPCRTLFLAWITYLGDIREQIVVVALQLPVIPSRAAEIENKLSSTKSGNGSAHKYLRNPSKTENIPHCCRAEQDNGQTAPTAQSLEAKAAGGVVERVAQDIEADVLGIACHGHSFFGGRGGGETGCRGPTFVSTLVWVSRDGCLGPKLLSAKFESLVIPIVSLCRLHEGMPGVGAHSARLDTATIAVSARSSNADHTVLHRERNREMIIYHSTVGGKPATPALVEPDPVSRMADAMLHIAGGGRTVDKDALSLMGFSAAEIDRYGIEARDLANAREQSRAA